MTTMTLPERTSRPRTPPSPAQVADTILDSVERRLESRPLPGATYRVQFNRSFTFRDARELVPYLAALGITHCYASPYLKARAGSPHGYDILDHNALNPELGSQDDYDEFVQELHAHGMGQILDVVPNHMGVAACDNAWWLDVLEHGPSSPYASFFDIDWMPLKPDLAHKVLLPVLGDQFGKVLEDQQLVLTHEEGSFWVRYYDHRFPIATRTLGILLGHRTEELERQLGGESPHMLEYHSILTAISHLPPRTESDPARIGELRREKEVIKRRITELCQASPEVQSFVEQDVRIFNGTRGDPRSFDLLDRLLQEQAYRLSNWRVAADEINYRRFFDINELAAIRMENPEVLSKTHGLIFKLLAGAQVNGLRIDHPDGLSDPADYLRRIQLAYFLDLCRECWKSEFAGRPRPIPEDSRARSGNGRHGPQQSVKSPGAVTAGERIAERNGLEAWAQIEPQLLARFEQAQRGEGLAVQARPLYVVAEKILEPGERVPASWLVHGTTGYEFLNQLNGIFVDQSRTQEFDRIYSQFTGQRLSFRDLVYESKKLIMQVSMSGEINVLGHQLDRISEQNRWSRDFTLNSLTGAIREIIACFPVYRTYITESGVLDRDRQYIATAVARAKRRNPAISSSIFDFVRDTLLLKTPDNADESTKAARSHFVSKFQQVTAPVMAKGVEDTTFYLYNRLLSLNEVGGDPDKFGNTLAAFHQQNLERQAHWPHGLLATSTHDTKRSEDVRARINILSEIPREWKSHLSRWSRLNQRRKVEVEGELAPSRNDEYLLYQTLIGVWPFEPLAGAEREQFIERVQQYLLKAMREAKANTSWISPNEPYERATHDFVAGILADSPRNLFLADFDPFARRVADCGIWNSLSQTILKLTCPGVPDLYQGTELWNFCLVDPDNRRPVDYSARTWILANLQRRIDASHGDLAELARELVEQRTDGRVKLFTIYQLLKYRRGHSELFTTGAYAPLESVGSRNEHLCAFARTTVDNTIVVVAPRLVAGLTGDSSSPPLGPEVWKDTTILLPQELHAASFRNILTGEVLDDHDAATATGLSAAAVFRMLPVALLELVRQPNSRLVARQSSASVA